MSYSIVRQAFGDAWIRRDEDLSCDIANQVLKVVAGVANIIPGVGQAISLGAGAALMGVNIAQGEGACADEITLYPIPTLPPEVRLETCNSPSYRTELQSRIAVLNGRRAYWDAYFAENPEINHASAAVAQNDIQWHIDDAVRLYGLCTQRSDISQQLAAQRRVDPRLEAAKAELRRLVTRQSAAVRFTGPTRGPVVPQESTGLSFDKPWLLPLGIVALAGVGVLLWKYNSRSHRYNKNAPSKKRAKSSRRVKT